MIPCQSDVIAHEAGRCQKCGYVQCRCSELFEVEIDSCLIKLRFLAHDRRATPLERRKALARVEEELARLVRELK